MLAPHDPPTILTASESLGELGNQWRPVEVSASIPMWQDLGTSFFSLVSDWFPLPTDNGSSVSYVFPLGHNVSLALEHIVPAPVGLYYSCPLVQRSVTMLLFLVLTLIWAVSTCVVCVCRRGSEVPTWCHHPPPFLCPPGPGFSAGLNLSCST